MRNPPKKCLRIFITDEVHAQLYRLAADKQITANQLASDLVTHQVEVSSPPPAAAAATPA